MYRSALLRGTSRLRTMRMTATSSSQAESSSHLLRSVLYVPAINERALSKSRGVAADAIIIDLEDGSGGGDDIKRKARLHFEGCIKDEDFGQRQVIVRINGLESPWFSADVEAVARAMQGPHGSSLTVCLPKVNTRNDVQTLQTSLSDVGAAPRIWAMIETPMGVLNAGSIASIAAGGWDAPAVPLTALVVGTTDLTADLRALTIPGRVNLATALSTVVLAARAYGLAALDGVCLDIPGKGNAASTSPFRDECAQGRAFGFTGKTLIHPGQVEAANEAYGPTVSELQMAERVIQAWSDAEARGQGVAVLTPEGRLVEALHAQDAKRTLAMWDAVKRRKDSMAAHA